MIGTSNLRAGRSIFDIVYQIEADWPRARTEQFVQRPASGDYAKYDSLEFRVLMLDPRSRPTILPPRPCRSAGHGVVRSKWGRPKAGPGGHEDDEDSRRESETSFCGFVVNLLPLLPLDIYGIHTCPA